MTTSRDDLREHLVAAIEAAPELPRESREHLADVFLDRLREEYDVVPRGTGKTPQAARSGKGGLFSRRWVKVALVLAFLIFVVPALLEHPPILLLIAVVVFFAMRRTRSRRTSGSWFI